jgi:hypothetical protein
LITTAAATKHNEEKESGTDMKTECYKLIDGKILPINIEQWKGTDQLGDITVHGWRISTVFLGIPHIGGMFETMIFGGPLDGWQVRAETLEQAHTNHARIVEALRDTNWLERYLDGNIGEKLLTKIVGLENG